MSKRILAAVGLAGSVVLSGCTYWPMLAAPARPECRAHHVIIYYNFQEEDLRASAQPAIQLVVERVTACQNAGGDLVSVSVVGFPNRKDSSVRGDATAVARGQAVLDALVAAGLPAEKIKLADYWLDAEDSDQPMRRRAEVVIEMR